MTKGKKSVDDELLMQKLRGILLGEDREAFARLKNTIDDPEKLAEKINPIIENHIEFLKDNFPKQYEESVSKIVDAKLVSYKTQILDEIYPSLGKMIKKYVTLQIQLLKDKIDEGVKTTFSVNTVKQKMKSVFFGVDESDLIISNFSQAVIEEVYVIQRDSGLLMGSASHNEMIDKEVVAGMLTAIKAFVEDAFQKEGDDLEMIQYGSYKIFIQSFHSFYIATAMSGALSNSEKDKLTDYINDFVTQENANIGTIDENSIKIISDQLEEHFIKELKIN